MVHGQEHKITNNFDKIGGRFGRRLESSKSGSGGLHHGWTTFQVPPKYDEIMGKSKSGHVCKSRKSPSGQICFSNSILGSGGGKCSTLPPRKFHRSLCKSPVDNHLTMVKSIVEQPAHKVLNDNSLLGWCTMVAPTSKTANPPHTGDFGAAISGDVQ